MSNLATANRVAPWIGIGTNGEWDNSYEALRDAHLDFHVSKEKTYWLEPTDPIAIIDPNNAVTTDLAELPMYANVRDTDNKVLGCVTPQYKIIQNVEAFSLIDPFLGNGGKITHAGMTMDGLCFMIAEVKAKKIIGNEEYTIFLMVTNSFNTKYPCQIIMTPVRIICQNMYRKLINDKIFLAKHTLTADRRLLALANGDAIEKKILTFSNVIDSMQGKKMTTEALNMLVAMLFPFPKEGGPREIAYKAKAEDLRQKFLDEFYDAPDNTVHHGNAFGFVNAYYDYLSHRGASRNTSIDWSDRRFSGLVSGLDVDTSLIKQAMK